jgi:hypothetical protein
LTNPLLAKKACSPAEKMNSSEQSRQTSVLSRYVVTGKTSPLQLDTSIRGGEYIAG